MFYSAHGFQDRNRPLKYHLVRDGVRRGRFLITMKVTTWPSCQRYLFLRFQDFRPIRVKILTSFGRLGLGKYFIDVVIVLRRVFNKYQKFLFFLEHGYESNSDNIQESSASHHEQL